MHIKQFPSKNHSHSHPPLSLSVKPNSLLIWLFLASASAVHWQDWLSTLVCSWWLTPGCLRGEASQKETLTGGSYGPPEVQAVSLTFTPIADTLAIPEHHTLEAELHNKSWFDCNPNIFNIVQTLIQVWDQIIMFPIEKMSPDLIRWIIIWILVVPQIGISFTHSVVMTSV